MTGHAAQDRSATGRRRLFHLLDAIRGIAAIGVAQRHLAWLMGADAWPSTYLAVDLFFVLSGFVIAYSYEDRLRGGMTWREFMALRIIRLYPLYTVGLLLGTIDLVGGQMVSKSQTIDFSIIGQAIFSAVLMLPNWGLPAIIGPRWSLTYELVGNAGYAAIVRWLSTPLLWSIIAVAGLALILCIRHYGAIDLGWEYWQAPIALARVTFSFGFGILLYRIHHGVASRGWALASAALAVVLAIAALATLGRGLLGMESFVVFVIFPALTIAAARVDVPAWGIPLCGFLGTTSYALYVIHQPAALLYEAIAQRLPPQHPLFLLLCRLGASDPVGPGRLGAGQMV